MQTEVIPVRGIAPQLLITQVDLTAPFLFTQPFYELPEHRFLRVLQSIKAGATPYPALGTFEYFELCLAAHHATVATFMPTDVDIHIRLKLWASAIEQNTDLTLVQKMSDLVLESRHWKFEPVSARWVRSPESHTILDGHAGEWFSTAAGAYGCLHRRDPERAALLAEAIISEVDRHAQVMKEFQIAKDGIGILKTAAILAHNLGDLDRVLDQWAVPKNDPLMELVFDCGSDTKPSAASLKRWGRTLQFAGAIYKAMLANENTRHFSLRKPRCLRRSADLLLPIGPFYDRWGAIVARHPALSPRDLGEIATALVDGWIWLAEKTAAGEKPPVGYARALNGILENIRGGSRELENNMPAKSAREMRSGTLRSLISIPRDRFEESIAKKALGFKLST